MAEKKVKKGTSRPKPLAHTPSLTKTRRRYGCGGSLKKNS